MRKEDNPQLFCTYGFSCLVVLDPKEEVMKVEAGESQFWTFVPAANTVAVKPLLLVRLAGKQMDTTNMNILTVSGNVYSVVVSESSQLVDLKLFLVRDDQEAAGNIEHPKYVLAGEQDGKLAELKKALDQSREENAQIKKTAAISEVKDTTHDYEWKRGKESESFGVKGIWHDSRFTYIEAHSQNAPALYEVDGDGKESVVQYNLVNGKYVVQHIIEHGRLKAGKKQLEFDRVKESV